jgi:hypothetical protein
VRGQAGGNVVVTPSQYHAARTALRWTHAEAGKAIGKSERMMYRYANGESTIPRGLGRLLRVLVYLRLTVSKNKFEQIVAEIARD